jgi:hypothetical protein
MQGRPLPDDFAIRARVFQLIDRHARERVGCNVADAIAAGLNAMHLDRRQIGHDVRRFLKLDPVVLDVLAGGEMAIAAVVAAGHMRQHAHLGGRQCSVRNGDAQHVGVKLKIKPVAKPQRPELRLRQFADKAAANLIAILRHPLFKETSVEFVVAIHRLSSQHPGAQYQAVGPKARICSRNPIGRIMPSSRETSII